MRFPEKVLLLTVRVHLYAQFFIAFRFCFRYHFRVVMSFSLYFSVFCFFFFGSNRTNHRCNSLLMRECVCLCCFSFHLNCPFRWLCLRHTIVCTCLSLSCRKTEYDLLCMLLNGTKCFPMAATSS